VYAQAAALGKPAIVSEMGQFDCYCPAARGFASVGVGWIAWELMLEHDQFSAFQGMVYKNGTFRSAAERDCLRALATDRQPVECPVPPPVPPVYPGPGGCAVDNCTIIEDTNTTFLSYNPPSTQKMLSCWTAWRGVGPITGTLHYCNVPGRTITFRPRANTSRVDLVIKSGPDCGVMHVNAVHSNGSTALLLSYDSYAPTVTWETVISLPPILFGIASIRISIADEHNPSSSNSWVQLVSVNVFH